jgi:lysophospholipase L1-like esterase
MKNSRNNISTNKNSSIKVISLPIFGFNSIDYNMNNFFKNIRLILLMLLCFHTSKAQQDSASWRLSTPKQYSFIQTGKNTIHNAHKLAPAFKKLQVVKARKKMVMRIVHIGDSHIQADWITEVLRNGFQEYFGNAGRGIVFPYQLGKSNGPADLQSSSNVSWTHNRCAHPEIDIANGISGFGIHSSVPNAYVTIKLKQDSNSSSKGFNKLSIFLGKDSACYSINAPNLNSTITQCTRKNVDSPSLVFSTDSLLTEFTLSKNTSTHEPFSFYGALLERKDAPGVLYHTIGCNGVQYSQLINNKLFCDQLHGIKGDMYIVSLGTNEAQNAHINIETFLNDVDSFVRLIRHIAPNAPIVITTPPGSYFMKKNPNATLDKVSKALIHYCTEKDLAYWDLYGISGAYKGAVQWNNNGLMAKDLVHFNATGYQLQGDLLLHALAQAYNAYQKANPYKVNVVPKPSTPNTIIKK